MVVVVFPFSATIIDAIVTLVLARAATRVVRAQILKKNKQRTPPNVALQSVRAGIEANFSSAANAEVQEERREELEELQQRLLDLENEIAQEAGERADERFKEVKLPTGSEAVEKIKAWLKRNDHSHWRASIDDVASKIIPKEQRAGTP